MTAVAQTERSLLVDELYRAALEGGQWQPAMARLKKLVKGSKVHFARICPADTWLSFYKECDPYYETAFIEAHLKNPILSYLTGIRSLDVFTDQSVMPKSEFRKTAIFNEWYVPQGDHSSIACKIPVAGMAGILAVQRGGRQPDFDDDDVSLLRELAPVIARAAELQLHLGHKRLDMQAAANPHLGQIIVDACGKVLSMNDYAETFLAEPGNDLTLVGGRLSAGQCGDALRSAIAAGCGPVCGYPAKSGNVLIRCKKTGSPLLALTIAPFVTAMAADLPVARAALILINDLSPKVSADFPEQLRGLFELTQKEAALAVILMLGHSLQYYMAHQQVSYETARSHLRNIFLKTATARQGELVALLNRVMRLSDTSH